MARLVSKLVSTDSAHLTPAQRASAAAQIRAARKDNPLRRALLGCHGWVRDPQASVGDFIWCTPCADWVRVDQVAE